MKKRTSEGVSKNMKEQIDALFDKEPLKTVQFGLMRDKEEFEDKMQVQTTLSTLDESQSSLGVAFVDKQQMMQMFSMRQVANPLNQFQVILRRDKKLFNPRLQALRVQIEEDEDYKVQN